MSNSKTKFNPHTNKIRLGIIDHDRCKPKKCQKECKKICPVVRQGKMCIEIKNVAVINEDMCIGCGQCVKACPFNAVQIVNLPTELEKDMLYIYGENCFRLYRLPIPKIGKIYGFIGQNGIGKSTLLNILNGRIKPNFGNYEIGLETNKIVERVRGTELQKYFQKLYKNELKVRTKPQNIERLQRELKNKQPQMTVKQLLDRNWDKENGFHNEIIKDMELELLFGSTVATLSGGELQRLLCVSVLLQDADVYIFDEPTNFLDIKQRLKVANLIRRCVKSDRYVFIVEHDLSILDYTSDYVSILYGAPGAYGAVSLPSSTAEGINIFFNGYIPAENMRFRPTAYSFREKVEIKIEEEDEKEKEKGLQIQYEDDEIKYDNFKLEIKGGKLPINCTMVILMGQNGTGKTTFLTNMAKSLGYTVSYKKQYINLSKYKMSVQDFLFSKIKKAMCSQLFISDVVKQFDIPNIYDKQVDKLSGGELQRVAITYCLGKDADIYLIDEPSASLDIEQRMVATRVIKRFLLHNKKIGFIVEHDIMMAITMAGSDMAATSCMVVFEEHKNEDSCRVSTASQPLPFSQGVNIFLKQLDVTFRTDPQFRRPRINKINSRKDVEQKKSGRYYQ